MEQREIPHQRQERRPLLPHGPGKQRSGQDDERQQPQEEDLRRRAGRPADLAQPDVAEYPAVPPVGARVPHPIRGRLLQGVPEVHQRLRGDRPQPPPVPVPVALDAFRVVPLPPGPVQDLPPDPQVGVSPAVGQAVILGAGLPQDPPARLERKDRVELQVVAHRPRGDDRERRQAEKRPVPQPPPDPPREGQQGGEEEGEEEHRRPDEVGRADERAGRSRAPGARFPVRPDQRQGGDQQERRVEDLAQQAERLIDEEPAAGRPGGGDQPRARPEDRLSQEVREDDRRQTEDRLGAEDRPIGAAREPVHGRQPRRVERDAARRLEPAAFEEHHGLPVEVGLVPDQPAEPRRVVGGRGGRPEVQGSPDDNDHREERHAAACFRRRRAESRVEEDRGAGRRQEDGQTVKERRRPNRGEQRVRDFRLDHGRRRPRGNDELPAAVPYGGDLQLEPVPRRRDQETVIDRVLRLHADLGPEDAPIPFHRGAHDPVRHDGPRRALLPGNGAPTPDSPDEEHLPRLGSTISEFQRPSRFPAGLREGDRKRRGEERQQGRRESQAPHQPPFPETDRIAPTPTSRRNRL